MPIFFFSSSMRFAPGSHRGRCRKGDGFWHGCCEPNIFLRNSQVVASKERYPARWLAAWNLARVWQSMIFSPLSSFFKHNANKCTEFLIFFFFVWNILVFSGRWLYQHPPPLLAKNFRFLFTWPKMIEKNVISVTWLNYKKHISSPTCNMQCHLHNFYKNIFVFF